MHRIGFRIARRKGAPEYAADVAAFQQGQVERQLGDPGGKADHAEPAFPRDRADRRFGIVPADDVIDHVRAFGPASGLERFGQRLGLILVERGAGIDHHFVRPGSTHCGGLVFARNRGDNFGAIGLAQFHGREPNPACRAEHQQRVASLQMSAIEQTVHIGAIGHQQRCPGFKAGVIGQRPDSRGIGQHFFSQPAIAEHRDYPVADLAVGHAFAQRIDHPGDFTTGRIGPLRLELIEVLNHQHVGEIDRASLDRNPDLTWAGDRAFDFIKGQRFGSASGVRAKGFHDTNSPVASHGVCPRLRFS